MRKKNSVKLVFSSVAESTAVGVRQCTLGAKGRQSVLRLTARQEPGFLKPLERWMQSHQLSFTEIDGLYLMRGITSFTVVRQVASLLNTLHWLYDIPVAFIENENDIAKVSKSGFLIPEYSSSPNISKPKKKL